MSSGPPSSSSTTAAEARFAVEQAQAAGCSLLVVTNTRLAGPVGSHAVVRCHAHSVNPELTLTAAVSVLQFIARQLAARLGKRASDRAALIGSLREAARARL